MTHDYSSYKESPEPISLFYVEVCQPVLWDTPHVRAPSVAVGTFRVTLCYWDIEPLISLCATRGFVFIQCLIMTLRRSVSVLVGRGIHLSNVKEENRKRPARLNASAALVTMEIGHKQLLRKTVRTPRADRRDASGRWDVFLVAPGWE